MVGHDPAQPVPPRGDNRIRGALMEKGVEWHLGRKVLAIHKSESGIRAELDNGMAIDAAAVLSAVGLRPHIQLAQDAGLEVERGIKVDQTGRTSDPDIYAIGDCAEYPQGLAAYVTPIMAAARAIAPSALGTPTDIRFPP